MQNLLSVVSRRWKEIIIITVITVILSVFFGFYYDKTAASNTVFINVGAGQPAGSAQAASPYESVQAADQFSETTMGWLKNPLLLDEIRTTSGFDVDLNVRKQEKQNLVVTFKTETPDQAKKIARISEEILRREIGRYNLATGSEFRMPIFNFYTKESSIPLPLFAAMGTLLGIILGYVLCALLEKFLKELHQFRHGKT